MTKHNLYEVILRVTGLIIGFYWITSLVWATELIGSEVIGWAIFQYLFQGLLIYLLLFQTDILIKLLFKIDPEDTIKGRFSTHSLVSAGIILFGFYAIIGSVEQIILYHLSDHQAFAFDLGDGTFITLKEVILAWIHLLIGILLISFKSEICRLIFWFDKEPGHTHDVT